MCHQHFVLILHIIYSYLSLTTYGHRWYSASVTESLYTIKDKDNFRPNFVNDAEHRYVAVDPTENKSVNNVWHSMKGLNFNNAKGIAFQNVSSLHPKNKSISVRDENNKEIHSNNTEKLISKIKKNITNDFVQNHTVNYPREERVVLNNTIHSTNIIRTRKKNRKCPTIRPRYKKQIITKNKNDLRFLEVFHVVEFEHVPCTSSSGLEGKCLHEYECKSSGGLTMGDCADGYGTCCVTQISCGEQTNTKLGWFTNPGFPSPSTERLSCAVTLDKESPDVVQIRLDFISFELLPPTYGTCEQDQFVVSGQNINSFIPILCGVNNGQHIYIEIGDVIGPLYLSIQTITPESRLFAIKISQLTSYDILAAPSGCLQYFTESQGYLESFNYQDISTIAIARNPSYLNNLNYAMCIKRASEMCTISYTNAGYIEIVNYDTDGLPVIPPGQAGVEIFNCPSDWLLTAAARLCGERLNDGSVLQDFSLDAPVTDSAAGPLIVWFRSDGAVTGRGYRLEYKQHSCTSPL